MNRVLRNQTQQKRQENPVDIELDQTVIQNNYQEAATNAITQAGFDTDQEMQQIDYRIVYIEGIRRILNIASSEELLPGAIETQIRLVDGDYKKWSNFKSSFEQFFHTNNTLSQQEKFYYLDAHLKPNSEPYNAISGYARIAENYVPAWDHLCEVYDNNRKLVEDMVTHYIDFPPINGASRNNLMAMINATNHITASLPKFKIKVEEWDAIMVPILVRKLDQETIKLWNLERPQREVAKLSQLLTCIQKRADSIDGGHIETPSTPPQQRSGSRPLMMQRNINNTATARQNSKNRFQSKMKKPIRCLECGHEHQLFKCPTFLKMNIDSRRRRVRHFGVCENCLKQFCRADKCSLGPCKTCNEKHNGLICPRATQPSVAVTGVANN